MQKYLFFSLLISVQLLFSQSIVINEVMSKNNSTIEDSEGGTPDWIELFNGGNDAVNLKGYALSDDPDELMKWVFPDVTIEPQDHLLVFASDKDLKDIIHWETVINQGDFWRYKIWNNQPPYSWKTLNFQDANWQIGKTGIGFADGDDVSVIPSGTITVYGRKIFTIEDPANIAQAILTMDYDDGFVAYLNDIEIARSNVSGSLPRYDELASGDHEALLYQGEIPESFKIDNIQDIIVQGNNILAVEVHNISSSSSDLSMIPFLTLGLLNPPENPNGTPVFLDLSSTNLHTNFKISSTGDILVLSDPSSTQLDYLEMGQMDADISFGRKPDGSDNWFYFLDPTPSTENSTTGFTELAGDPVFSLESGLYTSPTTIELSINSASAEIRYTTDGSIPTGTSTLYTNSIIIYETTIIRAATFIDNALAGDIITKSYIIDSEHDLPIVSLSSDPYNLWDLDYGIYTLGRDYDNNLPFFGANFWEDWERPIHVDYIKPSGELGFDIDGGVKIFGGWSRASDQKSLAIFARSKYGDSKISYKIFPHLDIDSFESIVLRNSANDRPYTMFRDCMMQKIVEGTNIDIQAYQQAAVYLNGEYWGLYNIREKLNEHYVASHYNIDKDDIDFLEGNGIANHGDDMAYWSFINYIETHNFNIQSNYEFIKTRMDIQNFIEYQVAQIYYDNTDWPGNNIKYWRERSDNGKWRWILFDTDFGFGLYDGFGYSASQRFLHNTLNFATATNGPEWPNPPWSTLILRKLLQNNDFKKQFINTYSDFLNTRFKPENIHQIVDTLAAKIENEIEQQYNRWEDYWWPSLNIWYDNVNFLKQFANMRPAYARIHLQSKFGINAPSRLRLKISPENSGKVQLNTLTLSEDFTGYYYKGIPIEMEAIASPGYKFKKWTRIEKSTPKVSVDVSVNIEITATFEKTSEAFNQVVINEINYQSSPDFDTGDWIELYNNSDNNIDISNWEFKDSNDDHSFIFPESSSIESKSYLLLCRDTEAFNSLHPEIHELEGDFDFGLSSNGEIIRLYDNVGYLIDSVNYGVDSPWPSQPAGTGATLSLKNPDLDNSIAESWETSDDHGTPGTQNSNFTSNTSEEQIVYDFALKQNYPNPFNGSTNISFCVPIACEINIAIYNITGQKIDEIINNHYQAGNYIINYSPDNTIPSSVYFYKLFRNNKLIFVKKMVYLK